MSIFPKRTIPGSGITIHCNIFSKHEKRIIFPFVTSIIKSPTGKSQQLFKGHVWSLPFDKEHPHDKSIPLLLLANTLNAKRREHLTKSLKNIQQGKHYYFHYSIPQEAEPGKYTVETEVWLDGICSKSATASEDCFYIEKVSLKSFEQNAEHKVSILHNHSPEPVPATLIKIDTSNSIDYNTLKLPPLVDTPVMFDHKAFFVYSEERECIALDPSMKNIWIKNQQCSYLSQKENSEEVTYVLHPAREDALLLTGESKGIWDKANELNLDEHSLTQYDKADINEMIEAGLLIKINLEKSIG